MMKQTQSLHWYERAKQVMPGGVNSPVRAFLQVDQPPVFITRGEGAYLYDVDGNRYIDYIGSWGPLIFGHAFLPVQEAIERACQSGVSFGATTPQETIFAEKLCQLLPGVASIRLVNSGTEAVMSAIRLARGATGRTKILKFSGCYHGHSDGLLVKGGSGLLTAGTPNSLGVPKAYTDLTLVCPYNDAESVKSCFLAHGDEIAAVIVEPVAANMGVCLPKPGFLRFLRDITQQFGALLIFDEVITGFRLGLGGAQAYFDVVADLVTYGMIFGGGLPGGAYGGRRELMAFVAPEGGVYQAGTLSGNPLAVAAGEAMIDELLSDETVYDRLAQQTTKLVTGLKALAVQAGIPVQINQIGSLFSLFMTDTPVYDEASAQQADRETYKMFFQTMLAHGVYIPPSPFEAWFVNVPHTDQVIDETLEAAAVAFKTLAQR